MNHIQTFQMDFCSQSLGTGGKSAAKLLSVLHTSFLQRLKGSFFYFFLCAMSESGKETVNLRVTKKHEPQKHTPCTHRLEEVTTMTQQL